MTVKWYRKVEYRKYKITVILSYWGVVLNVDSVIQQKCNIPPVEHSDRDCILWCMLFTPRGLETTCLSTFRAGLPKVSTCHFPTVWSLRSQPTRPMPLEQNGDNSEQLRDSYKNHSFCYPSVSASRVDHVFPFQSFLHRDLSALKRPSKISRIILISHQQHLCIVLV